MGEPKQKLAKREERLLSCAGVQTVGASTDCPSDAHGDICPDTRSVRAYTNSSIGDHSEATLR